MVGIAVFVDRQTSEETVRAFVYRKGQFTFLGREGFFNITPYSINDRGQIAGYPGMPVVSGTDL